MGHRVSPCSMASSVRTCRAVEIDKASRKLDRGDVMGRRLVGKWILAFDYAVRGVGLSAWS
jgi:hypothetical protein